MINGHLWYLSHDRSGDTLFLCTCCEIVDMSLGTQVQLTLHNM